MSKKNRKVWLSNVTLQDAATIMDIFPGVSIGMPRVKRGEGEYTASELCKIGLAGLYADSKERAAELRREPKQ